MLRPSPVISGRWRGKDAFFAPPCLYLSSVIEIKEEILGFWLSAVNRTEVILGSEGKCGLLKGFLSDWWTREVARKKIQESGKQCWSLVLLMQQHLKRDSLLQETICICETSYASPLLFHPTSIPPPPSLTNYLETSIFVNLSNISCAEPPLAILVFEEILAFCLVVSHCNVDSTHQNLSSRMWLVGAAVTTWKQGLNLVGKKNKFLDSNSFPEIKSRQHVYLKFYFCSISK